VYVRSTTGSQGVPISVSNAGYTKFRGSVRVLTTHSLRQFPRHRVPSGFKRTLVAGRAKRSSRYLPTKAQSGGECITQTHSQPRR
jgi:hypothetical protein